MDRGACNGREKRSGDNVTRRNFGGTLGGTGLRETRAKYRKEEEKMKGEGKDRQESRWVRLV